MQWASSLSQLSAQEDALDECAAAIHAQLRSARADLVVMFASPHHDRLSSPLAAAVQRRFPGATILGCSGEGVIGNGREVEHSAALSMTAAHLPQVLIRGFHVRNDGLPSPDAPPDDWASYLNVPLDEEAHFLVLADPMSMNGDALLSGLDFAYPAAAKIGGLASGARGPNHALFLGDMTYRDGAVGVALGGNIVVDTVVAQGCRPVGSAMRITQAQHNLLLGIDGQPPIEVLQHLYESLGPRDRDLVQHNLFMGIAMDPLIDEATAGEFLIRNVIGIDPHRGALAIGALLSEGQIVQFHVRDAETSGEDLRGSLNNYLSAAGEWGAAGALLFQCTGRGEYLYGEAGHDSAVFAELAGGLPLGGFFCNGEIGPVAGTTYLHGYTSSFAIFRPKVSVS